MSRIFQKKNNIELTRTIPSKINLDVMLEITLPSTFNTHVWEKISAASPQTFIQNQQDIKNILLNDQKLFKSYFHKFYSNHQQLNNWYMLANANQLDLKHYIFHNLLTRRYRQYWEILKEEKLISRYNKSNEVFRDEPEIVKEKKGDNFHKVILGSKSTMGSRHRDEMEQKKIRERMLQKENSELEIEQEDYHDLFLKTFSACDGSKYIYYDFNRHMKGVFDKKKYNDFIRIKKRKMHSSILDDPTSPSTQSYDVPYMVRSANISTHRYQNNYLHERQQSLEKLKYCTFSVEANGETKNKSYIQKLFLLKKSAGKLRKVNLNRQPPKFQIKRKKVL